MFGVWRLNVAHYTAHITNLDNFYDPDLMPLSPRRAHRALDRAVDCLYRRKDFAAERERVERLFMLYEKMCAPLGVGPREKARHAVGYNLPTESNRR